MSNNDRRPLVDGLKPITSEQSHAEAAFVYGTSRPAEPKLRPVVAQKAAEAPQVQPGLLPQMYNRVPITTRARPEVASALKRASLQRQLTGTEPFYVQDILEIALETWLRDNGHLQ
jgi:hypothetical protein